MRAKPVHQHHRLATLAAFTLMLAGTAGASQVTTERIIITPEFSTSSSSAPATLSGHPADSGHSGTSLNGLSSSESPVIGAEGQGPFEENENPIVAPSNRPLPPILTDIDALPAPVRRMHQAIHAAALSGDLEKLRLPIEMNEVPPVLGLGSDEDDPLEQLRALSEDPSGSEILAILSEVLEAGFVLSEPGTPQEMYVWPYFADYPLDRLDNRQKVDLFRLITWADYADMQALGHYSFYRLGISKDGVWHFFLAGD